MTSSCNFQTDTDADMADNNNHFLHDSAEAKNGNFLE